MVVLHVSDGHAVRGAGGEDVISILDRRIGIYAGQAATDAGTETYALVYAGAEEAESLEVAVADQHISVVGEMHAQLSLQLRWEPRICK